MNGSVINQSNSNRYKHNNSTENLQNSSTNISKHKLIDCDNLNKSNSDRKLTPHLRNNSTEGKKSITPINTNGLLRFFRNSTNENSNVQSKNE